MPSSWLNVPHFQQELEYSCVAACVRMVLAHYGDNRSEAEVRLLLDTQPTGTRAGNVMRLSGPPSRFTFAPQIWSNCKRPWPTLNLPSSF
jgi:hypothetical protein